MHYHFGRQRNPSQLMMPWLRATPGCRGPTSTMLERSRSCRHCAPRWAGADCGDDQCGVAGAGRCARAGCGNTVRARRPCRRRGGDRRQPGGSRQRRWPGPGVLLWRCRRSRAERATHARIVCTFLDGVFTSGAPVLEHYELGDAEYALRSAVRSAAEALSTIGLGSSDVANPVASSSSCSNRHGNTGFPTTRHRAHCGCSRMPRTSMRSSRSVPG